ncbi:MAG: hypothetical protein HY305_04650, partial [Sphingobacteriales bacterium]|nr:hypothetical protein [Sphingobacteriales bacterium]
AKGYWQLKTKTTKTNIGRDTVKHTGNSANETKNKSAIQNNTRVENKSGINNSTKGNLNSSEFTDLSNDNTSNKMSSAVTQQHVTNSIINSSLSDNEDNSNELTSNSSSTSNISTRQVTSNKKSFTKRTPIHKYVKGYVTFDNSTINFENSIDHEENITAQIPVVSRRLFSVDKIITLIPSPGNEELKSKSKVSRVFPDCPTVEKEVSKSIEYLEVYVGPDYAIKTLTDMSSINTSYLQKRKASTTFTSAYSAGLRYTKVFKSGISLRGGLNYSQVNEKFTSLQPDTLLR